MDDGQAISYKVLSRGTPVISADGVKLGTVRRTQEAKREHIFDGIVVDTGSRKVFVDAPEVARIAERRVTLTIPSADTASLPEHRGLLGAVETSARRSAARWRRRFGGR
jgi:hypothetical protein